MSGLPTDAGRGYRRRRVRRFGARVRSASLHAPDLHPHATLRPPPAERLLVPAPALALVDDHRMLRLPRTVLHVPRGLLHPLSSRAFGGGGFASAWFELRRRHRRQVGGLVIRDDRVVRHAALRDYEWPWRRLMHRVTAGGSVPC